MENKHRRIDLNLDVIPVNGVNPDVSCAKCPSACCREGMALELNPDEAAMLVENGTVLRKLSRRDVKRAGAEKPVKGNDMYVFESNCGNLTVDPDTNETGCAIYGTDQYPRTCAAFKMGGAACVSVQRTRINRGEDILSDEES